MVLAGGEGAAVHSAPCSTHGRGQKGLEVSGFQGRGFGGFMDHGYRIAWNFWTRFEASSVRGDPEIAWYNAYGPVREPKASTVDSQAPSIESQTLK